MDNDQICFLSENQVTLRRSKCDDMTDPNAIRIRTEKSIISAGTELACLRGSESWAPFPFVPGYGSVGRVVDVGDAVEEFNVGDRVFTYGRHEQYSFANTVIEKIPDDLPSEKAVFARMAAVAITALRVADAELGDKVAVQGLGLVGNLAAQLFTLAGCDVIAVDLSEKRRRIAEKCGIWRTLAPSDPLEDEITELTDGKKCRSVIDATGVPAAVEKAPRLAGKDGELILLGSPRGEYKTDLTAFLNFSHLAGFGCITVKGAHEYRFPQREDPEYRYRHSFQSNVKVILDRIADNRLKTEELITHRVKPAECEKIYNDLRLSGGEAMGVIFDWTDA
jgi:2-desacetyl-2-hydroxyethyl bacteriochlorophyllide A dehydrogenase